MSSLKERAERAGLDFDALIEAAMEVTESYADSGSESATHLSIPELYKNMIIAQIEVFEPYYK